MMSEKRRNGLVPRQPRAQYTSHAYLALRFQSYLTRPAKSLKMFMACWTGRPHFVPEGIIHTTKVGPSTETEVVELANRLLEP